MAVVAVAVALVVLAGFGAASPIVLKDAKLGTSEQSKMTDGATAYTRTLVVKIQAEKSTDLALDQFFLRLPDGRGWAPVFGVGLTLDEFGKVASPPSQVQMPVTAPAGKGVCLNLLFRAAEQYDDPDEIVWKSGRTTASADLTRASANVTAFDCV